MEIEPKPRVSVIIPAYNQGELLARAIDSALTQSYENKEIIVVNDGSSDSVTRATACQYGDRIIYIERQHGGVAAARNTGLERAQGNLIALLDQDDVWLPGKLDRQVTILVANRDIGLVHSSYYLIDRNSKRIGQRRLKEGRWRPMPSLLLDVPISSCTALFPMRIIDKVGPFDPMMNGSDDWDLWLRIAAKGHRFYCISEPLAEYRVHSEMTSKDALMMVRSGLAVLDGFYRRMPISPGAIAVKNQAYFRRLSWATTVYYGLGRLDRASEQLNAAVALYPEGIATGRFLRSLVQARAQAQGVQPSSQLAHEAATFLLREAKLSRQLSHKLVARAEFVISLYASGGLTTVAKQVAVALLKHPELILDREILSAAGRRARRIT